MVNQGGGFGELNHGKMFDRVVIMASSWVSSDDHGTMHWAELVNPQKNTYGLAELQLLLYFG